MFTDICKMLHNRFGVKISQSTVKRAMKELGWIKSRQPSASEQLPGILSTPANIPRFLTVSVRLRGQLSFTELVPGGLSNSLGLNYSFGSSMDSFLPPFPSSAPSNSCSQETPDDLRIAEILDNQRKLMKSLESLHSLVKQLVENPCPRCLNKV